MTLKARFESDLKASMRSGDILRRSVIRLLRSEVHNQEIAAQTDLDDQGVIHVLSRQAQQRRDSIEAYRNAGRQDLVDKETNELQIILGYMPTQMTRDEIQEIVRNVITETGAQGPQDIGKVMGIVIPKTKGRADGGRVSAIVKTLLEEKAD